MLLGLMWVGAEYVFEGAVHSSLVDSFVNALLTSLMVARMKQIFGGEIMRPINADGLKQLIDWNVPSPEWIFYYIDLMPTLSYEKLAPQGEWIHDYNNLYGCSACLERESMSPKSKKPYCPNCGAKMKG